MHESDEFPGEEETDVAVFVDPRNVQMGVRILCHEESLELDESEFTRIDSPIEYDAIR